MFYIKYYFYIIYYSFILILKGSYFKSEFNIHQGIFKKACILLAYWLFISTYKAHNALFCMTIFYIP